MSIRYELCPQMKIYDKLNFEWKPFVMFSQPSGIRTEILNTDIDGLRFNNINEIVNKSVFDQDKKNKKISVLLGGSTAFGVGSTKDENTISSYLSNEQNHCFNLASRSYVGIQEIIIFLTKINELKNLKKIYLLSGINDFYMLQNFENNSPGGFYFNEYFHKHINYKRNIGLEILNLLSFNKLSIHQVQNLNLNEMIKLLFSKNFKKKISERSQRKISFDEHFDRYFMILSLLLKSLNVQFKYVLQPYIHWCKDMSSEENHLINENSKSKNSYNANSLKGEINYQKLLRTIKKYSELYNFEFINLNEFIRDKSSKKDWLFVDSIHLNDTGYKLLSERIF